jgi:hypothetical protein
MLTGLGSSMSEIPDAVLGKVFILDRMHYGPIRSSALTSFSTLDGTSFVLGAGWAFRDYKCRCRDDEGGADRCR